MTEPKLTGDAYLEFWRERIARGPAECGASDYMLDLQADTFAAAVLAVLGGYRPTCVLEFGSGWGRMLERWRAFWPSAEVHGVELCRPAALGSWRDARTTVHHTEDGTVPGALQAHDFDLVLTVTCLQHVTDDALLREVAGGLGEALVSDGRLVMVENVARPGAAHVRDATVLDYQNLFPGLWWAPSLKLTWGGQAHAAMSGGR